MSLVIDAQPEADGVDFTRLHAVGRAVLSEELGRDAEVSVVLCGDAAIAELNQNYLRHEGPTDVISFPQLDLTPGQRVELPEPALLGDVVISVETAARQAEGYAGWGTADELALLLVHGLLHLCGYDDQTPEARTAMRRREDALLARCGIGPVPREED